tara:strand:+ start:1819 stop:2049 length:231 start_codon:yes stop_codon:yes gene_type:complete
MEKNIKDVLKDCHLLVDELRDKLKKKCNDVLDLRKEVDRLNEELQLCELRYNTIKTKVDEYTQDPLNKGRIDDSSR